MNGKILVLDDTPARHEVFQAATELEVVHVYDVEAFRNAIEEAGALRLIALDHDLLRPIDRRTGPCGCEAAELVAARAPGEVPVLIHSANDAASHAMRRILVRSKRPGRVARVNIRTVGGESEQRDSVEILAVTLRGVLAAPCWPPGIEPDELLEMLGDDPSARCATRAALDGYRRAVEES